MPNGVRMKLSVRNASAVVANFRAADAKLQARVREIVQENGKFARDLAQHLAPVKTGFLREHITTVYSESGLAFEMGWFAADFAEAGLAFYAEWVEHGTSRMAAQPSITPAFEQTVPRFKRQIARAVAVSRRRTA